MSPDGAGRVPSYTYEYRQLSKAKRLDAQAAVRIVRNSVSNKGKTLDYRKSATFDNGRTTARRQIAAAYLWPGKVTNISKVELKKVKTFVPKKKRPSKFDARAPRHRGTLMDANPMCTGKSGQKTYDKYGVRRGWAIYLNRCEAVNLQAGALSVGFVTGVLAISLADEPPTAAALGTVAAIAGLGAGVIDVLQNYSPTRSIYFAVISSPVGSNITAHPQKSRGQRDDSSSGVAVPAPSDHHRDPLALTFILALVSLCGVGFLSGVGIWPFLAVLAVSVAVTALTISASRRV